jgi:thioredoxin reductase
MEYDICIIGLGVAGAFATLKITESYKNTKVLAFDIGRKWAKRRRQTDGFLGCLPNSDGKLYLSNMPKVAKLVGDENTQTAYNWVIDTLSNIDSFKISKDKYPISKISKKIKKLGYNIFLNDYIQIYPKDVHALSRFMAAHFEKNKNITFNFDTEIIDIDKKDDLFIINAEGQLFKSKKLILAVGRSGWRWAAKIYNKFNIIKNNDFAKFGIRIEMNSSILKDFNKSTCTITKDELEIGPFNWFGTIIPEDHLDMAISAFRSNENRWKTDKVMFPIISNRFYINKGLEQTDRLAKLTFILSNDRILKEKISNILLNKSKISVIPEYDWLKNTIMELSSIIPDICTKAYFHVPTINPIAPEINLKENLESEIKDMFIAGESTGVSGILAASIMGCIAADETCRRLYG